MPMHRTTASGTYSAIAASTYTLTLNSDGVTGYIVNQPFGTGSDNIYNAGAVVQLTANAYFGYHFVSWAGDASGSGTQNPTTITMNGNKTASANFAAGDPNLGTVIVTIQPPEAAAAGMTWGFNDNDFRASGTSYSYYPETLWVELTTRTAGWIWRAGGDIYSRHDDELHLCRFLHKRQYHWMIRELITNWLVQQVILEAWTAQIVQRRFSQPKVWLWIMRQYFCH